jgi:hypothetical protein
MAKKAENQTSAKPDETPVSETAQVEVQNPAEAEVKQDKVETSQLDETPKNRVIVVLKRFRDKTDHKTLFAIGQEVEFDQERAANAVSRGLAKFKDDNE